MKKLTKAALSILLCAVIAFSGCTTAFAASDASPAVLTAVSDVLTSGLNAAADVLLRVLSFLIPASVRVKDVSEHSSEGFMQGTSEFKTQAAPGARWRLGYANASIVMPDIDSGRYYRGGYTANTALTGCYDDLKVRVVALSDGDSGIVILAAVDCIGLANADVRRIRLSLEEYSRQHGIVSINVSATHTHSGTDTQGLYTDTYRSILQNLGSCIFRSDMLADAVDEGFMNNIIEKTGECVKRAVETMTSGELTYSHCDVGGLLRDRTAPDVSIDELYRLRFTPDDGSAPTVIASFGVHPEAMGRNDNLALSDFIYYTERVLNEAGCNFIFLQGAVGTMAADTTLSSDGLSLSRVQAAERYGEEIGYILLGMTMSRQQRIAISNKDREAAAEGSSGYTPWYDGIEACAEKTVEPILNVRLKEYMAPVENGVYKALGKASVSNNAMYKTGRLGEIVTCTEVGYMQLGFLKVILCPGETYGELICGGEALEGFGLPCVYEKLESSDVIVLDLMNDALGYLMPDNAFCYFNISTDDGLELTDGWGLTSLGRGAASSIYGEIYSLYDSVSAG